MGVLLSQRESSRQRYRNGYKKQTRRGLGHATFSIWAGL